MKEAAEALRLTAQDLLNLGVIDRIVPEPRGGAQRDKPETIARVGAAIGRAARRARRQEARRAPQGPPPEVPRHGTEVAGGLMTESLLRALADVPARPDMVTTTRPLRSRRNLERPAAQQRAAGRRRARPPRRSARGAAPAGG